MNQKKNYLTTPKESGFTLVEVIVAVAILSFVIFATLRVITASLNSITRQGQRVKALHLAQAHLAKLEAESFPKVVPENWRIDSGATYSLSLNMYDPNVSASETFVSSDDNYWYSSDGLGFSPNDNNDDGILVVENKDGTTSVFTRNDPSPASSTEYSWNSSNLTLTFFSSDEGKEIQIYYRYYHLVKEGGTVPSSDGEGLKEKVIKVCTDVGDTNGNGTDGEKDDILGEDLTDADPLSSSDYENFDPQTGELTFIATKRSHSVWIYYLPQKTTDSDGDGYDDPGDKSILGVVEGSFCNPDGSLANQITNTKKLTVTEFWKQGKDVQSTTQETYITR